MGILRGLVVIVMVMVVAGRGVSPRPIKYKYQAAVLNLKKVDLDFSQLTINPKIIIIRYICKPSAC